MWTMHEYRKALDTMSTDENDDAPVTIPGPSVGRTVLYTTPDGSVWPAIVSEVDLTQPMVCGLTVFGMQGPSVADIVRYDSAGPPGTWRWPEYVFSRSS